MDDGEWRGRWTYVIFAPPIAPSAVSSSSISRARSVSR